MKIGTLEVELSERISFYEREKQKFNEEHLLKEEIINNLKLTVDNLRKENNELVQRLKELEERGKQQLHMEIERLRHQALEYQQLSLVIS